MKKEKESKPKYLPSIEEIYERAEEIRSEWSDYRRRYSGEQNNQKEVEIPIISTKYVGKKLNTPKFF